MDKITKIGTCCYCSRRSTLVLDRVRHELACPSCGAPLHHMKRLKAEPATQPTQYPRRKPEKPKKPCKDKRDYDDRYSKKKKKIKKRKPLWYKAIEEVIDFFD